MTNYDIRVQRDYGTHQKLLDSQESKLDVALSYAKGTLEFAAVAAVVSSALAVTTPFVIAKYAREKYDEKYHTKEKN